MSPEVFLGGETVSCAVSLCVRTSGMGFSELRCFAAGVSVLYCSAYLVPFFSGIRGEADQSLGSRMV